MPPIPGFRVSVGSSPSFSAASTVSRYTSENGGAAIFRPFFGLTIDRPFPHFFEVLWPLLTSRSSLLLWLGSQPLIAVTRIAFFSARAICETSPGTHTFFHSYTRHVYRKRFRAAIGLWLVWQSYPRLRPDMISVRRARVLPPPSFRFRLATDTLGFGYDLPAAGRSRDFHPLERALAGRTIQKTVPAGPGPFYEGWMGITGRWGRCSGRTPPA